MSDTPIDQLVKQFETRMKRDEPLGRYTTLKIGGPADLFIDAKTIEVLTSAVGEARRLSIPVFILGGGTNILIGDKGIRGLVIKNSTGKISIRGVKGETINGVSKKRAYVETESGVAFNKFVRFCVEEGLAGVEMQLGLPGTVGGALYMNSKWTHPVAYVGDTVYQAEIFTSDNTLKVVPKSYFQFGYDTSSIQKTGDIVTKVIFVLTVENRESLWQTANESIAYRRETQPQGVFTAGCTFRNVDNATVLSLGLPKEATSAGFLIDHAGLKNAISGRAVISDQHANFIVNNGGATASDVIQLISRAKEQVKRQFGVDLEEEIVRVGEF